MKKLLLCLVFSFSTLLAIGQHTQFGFFIEPTYNWNKIDNAFIDGSPSIGFSYGLVVDYLMTDRYTVHTGLSHSMIKSNLDKQTGDGREIYEYRLHFLEIPATLKLRTNQLGHFKYYGLLGMTPGVLMKARRDLDSPLGFSEENVKAGEDIRKINLALTFGAGLEYAIDDVTSIFAGLHFNNGFTNLIDDKDDNKISWSNIGIKAGILF